MQDDGGDENFHLWGIDATTPSSAARDLTPFPGAKAQNVVTNKRFPDQLLVGINKRDPTQFDMYRCTLATGTEDESFEVREAIVMNPADSSTAADSSTTVRVRDSAGDEWRDLVTFPYGEEGNMVEFARDGKSVLALSTLGRETQALALVRAVSFNYARTERRFFDKELEADFRALEAAAPGGAEEAGGTVSPLFVSQPALLEYKLAKMEDVRITARDGRSSSSRLPREEARLELVAYLTRADSDAPTPLVLLVHGGPWARDGWGFNAMAQWMANRGYAVLQVNYRGSSGYGKSFLHKGDKQWGVGDMQHDLSDAVAWAVREGIAREDRVCIFGGSYGGYATLAGMTFTPELYACGVDIVGPSNIKTLLDSIPPYWGPLRNDMLLKAGEGKKRGEEEEEDPPPPPHAPPPLSQIGDVDNDADFNQKISPLFHGANDPRVKQAEADQIAFSMAAKRIPVEYVLYPDEGHGFARPANRIDFNGRTEEFLAKHLGGRAEAFEPPEGATATFPLETRSFEYEPAQVVY
ncbi:hypothetical protein EMIHUDRAFT_107292 [Emiliania huxleyi CCMP1516]|uniref:Peptidase S9 prolyl oligopeptidase catalytic domain-containing protein n=2 Tax=Emiliania huxleyi TaxID=2903 RepID=A0A0D3I2Z9_EMIH1|nr:hypothetical protein EMIHUDRAFT_107292 [Emiliania huxleyi CCMP1516]EOD05634.1 hypothetical protein EMIHUDRAFT_107292 [Emiliania huxleyi CCMP1516]|eukprot:XP_005758063.1 hypothetical protein EMIHUDRAFT_107292 [Emiliania huxleyi CCMP1516]